MTSRDRRALVVGGSVVLVAVMLLRLLPWTVREVVTLRARAIDHVATLERTRALVAALPAHRDSLREALGALVGLAPKLVDGATSAEAQASLSALVSLASSRHGLKILRLDPLPDSAAGAFQRVAVHAECEGDAGGLTALLRSLETGTTLLTVPVISVQATDPWTEGKAPERLRIELTVTGWYLAREGT